MKAQILLGYSKEITCDILRQVLVCFHNSDLTALLEKKHFSMSPEVFCCIIIKDKTFSFSDMQMKTCLLKGLTKLFKASF